MADATDVDPAAVVGDECHIAAQSPGGPRFSADAKGVDSEENLILLCRVDHKRVDDQPAYFTSERLRAIKTAHESWVHASLSTAPPAILPIRLRRRDNGRTSLKLVNGGGELLSLVLGSAAYDFDHDDLASEAEVDLVASFLQALQDFGEAGDDLESGGRVTARYELGKMLAELGNSGFFVYGAQVPHVLEGGVGPPSHWPISYVRVKRIREVVASALNDLAKAEGHDSDSAT